MVQRVNGYRARGFVCGGRYFGPTHALTPHIALQRAARAHSWDMGRRNYFDHETPDGHDPSDRARSAGYPGGAAENIQAGGRTSHSVVDDWMQSAGHCENFMSPAYRDIGIGRAEVHGSDYGTYWTAKMGAG